MAQGFEDERGGGACISEHKRIADAQNTPAEAVEQRGALGIVFDLTSHIVRWPSISMISFASMQAKSAI